MEDKNKDLKSKNILKETLSNIQGDLGKLNHAQLLFYLTMTRSVLESLVKDQDPVSGEEK